MACGIGIDMAKHLEEPLFEVLSERRFFAIGLDADEDAEFETEVKKAAQPGATDNPGDAQ